SASSNVVSRFSPFIDKIKVIGGIGLAGAVGSGTISRRPYSSGKTRASISNRCRQSFSSKSERTMRAFARPRARVTACANCAKGRSPASPTNAEQLNQIRIMNANNAREITISARSQTPLAENLKKPASTESGALFGTHIKEGIDIGRDWVRRGRQ